MEFGVVNCGGCSVGSADNKLTDAPISGREEMRRARISGGRGESDNMGRGERTDGITVALAGNPNVGKSTLFNSLTGMHAHTGNWAGKTVECMKGYVKKSILRRAGCGGEVCLFDIPGTYSLYSHSEEERVARDFIAFGNADATVVVCDATSLMQNLNLFLQIAETGKPAVLVLNLMDEAKRRGIVIDTKRLSSILGAEVVECVAREKSGLFRVVSAAARCTAADRRGRLYTVRYGEEIERAAEIISSSILSMRTLCERISVDSAFARWIALRILEGEEELCEEIFSYLGVDERERTVILDALTDAEMMLFQSGLTRECVKDTTVENIVQKAAEIALSVTECEGEKIEMCRADKFLTGRWTAYPVMLLLLGLVLWITLSLANYPSALLSRLFSWTETELILWLEGLQAPRFITEGLVSGALGTLFDVVAVMLPPMAIFFPLFSLLEDSGYLPRIAYNLDRPFAAVGACGKQALTMCMGLGCNAVGIVGCRIIDSRRERLIAALSNSLIPCNGRLPMLITLLTVFLLSVCGGAESFLVAALLALMIVLAVAATFGVSLLLSRTLLRGEKSAFTIELPPYRRPQFLRVILRALLDKCLSVLARAAVVAAPMGLLTWILSTVDVGDSSLLWAAAELLEPIGAFFGMDGVILLAFILGIPANEIVVPLMLAIYSSGGAAPMTDSIFSLFYSNGWTALTAASTAAFALFHWPCATSLITLYRETHSKRAVFLGFAIPTVLGLICCLFIRAVFLLL